jgi:Rieske Fe-S protein
MAEKMERGFMSIRIQMRRGSLNFLLLLITLSCNQDRVDDPIPYRDFPNIIINITSYPALMSDGGYILVNDGGVRGIILYRKNSTTYYAFERNCTFQPNDACATVDIHASTLFMQDACCGSSFNFDGNPTGGPAWRPLQRYETLLSGNTLIITDSIVD